MKTRLIVLGIDGGTLGLVEQWRSELPAFDWLLRKGAYGILKSTVPPITCPAWPCMFTGMNPAQLGMFYFVEPLTGRIHDYDDWHKFAVWRRIEAAGMRVGVYNVPITYPPKPINGFMVSGMGTPPGRDDFVYPSDLRHELPADYAPMLAVNLLARGKEPEYSVFLPSALKGRCAVAKTLMGTVPCDAYFIGLFETDLAQHYFWHHMDESHPWHAISPFEGVILDMYRIVDDFLAYLMREYPDATLLVVSDHGFMGFTKAFSVNRWLEMKGYLKMLKEDGERWYDRLIRNARDFVLANVSPQKANAIARLLPDWVMRRVRGADEESRRERGLLESIDWEHTVAFSLGISGAIYVVNCDREQEIVNRIADELTEAGIRVHRKSEVYFGPYEPNAPDLVVEGGDGICPTSLANSRNLWDEPFASGMHSPRGMFIAYRKGIRGGLLEGLQIYDVTPTALKMLGLEVPRGLYGIAAEL